MSGTVGGPVNGARRNPVDLARLSKLIDMTAGRSDVVVGIIDGPVAVDHPGFARDSIRTSVTGNGCSARDAACVHGTFVTGILAARRGSPAPAICPECTLVLRPIFGDRRPGSGHAPSATPGELAAAIVECLGHGAQILNISAELTGARVEDRSDLSQALDLAARRGVLVIAAAGNRGRVAGSTLIRHPWVVPVVAYGVSGRPVHGGTLGGSIGRRGLGAPGERITSLAPDGGTVQLGGSSAATPFVTGAAALIWSELPAVSGPELRLALTSSAGGSRRTVVPPLLDAWRAYRTLQNGGGM